MKTASAFYLFNLRKLSVILALISRMQTHGDFVIVPTRQPLNFTRAIVLTFYTVFIHIYTRIFTFFCSLYTQDFREYSLFFITLSVFSQF